MTYTHTTCYRHHRLHKTALKDILCYCQPELVLTGVSGTQQLKSGCLSLYVLQDCFRPREMKLIFKVYFPWLYPVMQIVSILSAKVWKYLGLYNGGEVLFLNSTSTCFLFSYLGQSTDLLRAFSFHSKIVLTERIVDYPVTGSVLCFWKRQAAVKCNFSMRKAARTKFNSSPQYRCGGKPQR